MKTSTTRILIFMTALLIGGIATAQTDEKKEDLQEKKEEKKKTETFGEFAVKMGKGIWNRFNERFNLEKAGKELVKKKDKILSPFQKKEEIPKPTQPEKDDSNKPAQDDGG